MIADIQFRYQSNAFWAYVRALSQIIGYTGDKKTIKVPTLPEMAEAMVKLSLPISSLVNSEGDATQLAEKLLSYFSHRAKLLNEDAKNHLMDRAEAEKLFLELRKTYKPKCPLPFNKQKGQKKGYAFLTGIVNILIESKLEGQACNYDPRALTVITKNGEPLRTLARRVDGAFPNGVNPIAIWEIKEYYNTKTFGSRVADGVYETLLDGMELQELWEHESINVLHYLIVDDRFTWWECGRSYLCRIVDMLHMGYVDEVLVGREVVSRVPEIVANWVVELKRRSAS